MFIIAFKYWYCFQYFEKKFYSLYRNEINLSQYYSSTNYTKFLLNYQVFLSKIIIFLNIFLKFIKIKYIGFKSIFLNILKINLKGVNNIIAAFFSVLKTNIPNLIKYLLINRRYKVVPIIIPIKIYNLNSPLLNINIDVIIMNIDIIQKEISSIYVTISEVFIVLLNILNISKIIPIIVPTTIKTKKEKSCSALFVYILSPI